MAGLFGDVPYTEDTPDLMAGDVLSDILPWRVYDSEKQLYHFTHGSGFLMEVGSAIGNSELAENIGGVLAANLPSDATFQVINWTSPSITPISGPWQRVRTGLPITTVASSVVSTFGTGGAYWNQYYPEDSEDGLLVPMNAWEDRGHGLRTWLEAWIVKLPLKEDCTFDPYCNSQIDTLAEETVLESGWDITNEVPVIWSVGWLTNYSVFALVNQNTSVTRNVIRFLQLEHFTEADPAGAERFYENRMTARVVYNNVSPENGAAELTFEFEGACCDSFTDNGAELCE